MNDHRIHFVDTTMRCLEIDKNLSFYLLTGIARCYVGIAGNCVVLRLDTMQQLGQGILTINVVGGGGKHVCHARSSFCCNTGVVIGQDHQ